MTSATTSDPEIIRRCRAQSEFVSWGRRDCELGIRELATATSTVLQKRAEYRQRLQHLQTMLQRIDPPIVAVEQKLTAIIAKRVQLKEVEESLSPYNRLPPDISLASVEIERARQELVLPVQWPRVLTDDCRSD